MATHAAARPEDAARAMGRHDFRATLAYLKPQPDEERWTSIPWQTDLWAARRLALEGNRPIFMWAMNGNPLGCV